MWAKGKKGVGRGRGGKKSLGEAVRGRSRGRKGLGNRLTSRVKMG